MTTGLFLLRCIQTGLSMSDLEKMTFGMALDLITERNNDGEDYNTYRVATQEDFDRF